MFSTPRWLKRQDDYQGILGKKPNTQKKQNNNDLKFGQYLYKLVG